jgi:hypothetical protein
LIAGGFQIHMEGGRIMELNKNKLFYTEKELEAMGLCDAATLRNHRCQGIGLPYVKVGKKVVYRKDHLIKFLKANTRYPENLSRKAS